ncbi:hypothetical protein D3C72_675450 [compost metagenome]
MPFPVRGFLRHHHQHIPALEFDQLLGKVNSGAVQCRRRQANATEQSRGVFRQNSRRADAKNRHLPRFAQQRHRLRQGVAVGRFRQHFAGVLMPFEDEIDTGIDVAGQRFHRGGDLFAGAERGAKPVLKRLFEVA